MSKEYVCLIETEDAKHIPEIPVVDGKICEGVVVPDNQEQCWITTPALEGLRDLELWPDILDRVEVLPSFHGPASAIDTANYGPSLTIEALAADPEAVGVVYMGWGCEKALSFQMMEYPESFFYYTRKEGREFIWLILTDPKEEYSSAGAELAQWVWQLHSYDENMKMFLEALGFSLERTEDNET